MTTLALDLKTNQPGNAQSARVLPGNRMITRALIEYSTALSITLIDSFDGYYEAGLVFLGLLLGTGAVHRFRPGEGASPPPAYFISINALAASMRRPFETARRHVIRLIETGWCVQDSRGICIPAAVLETRARDLLIAVHDGFVGLLENLSDLDVSLKSASPKPRQREEVVLESALKLILKCVEIGPVEYGGWTQALIYTAVMAANTRHITLDVDLAHRYADIKTPPPQALRSPIGIGALARTLHLPYPTVRRHVLSQLEAGMMERVGDGVIITAAWINRPSLLMQSELLGKRIIEIIQRLDESGFPLDNPGIARIGPI